MKVLVSEFGAEWVPHFIRHMDQSRGKARAAGRLLHEVDGLDETVKRLFLRENGMKLSSGIA